MISLFKRRPKRPPIIQFDQDDEPKIPVRDVLEGAWARRREIWQEARRLYREGPARFQASTKETRYTALGLLGGFALIFGIGIYQVVTPTPDPKTLFDTRPLAKTLSDIAAVKPKLAQIAPKPSDIAAAAAKMQQQPAKAAPAAQPEKPSGETDASHRP